MTAPKPKISVIVCTYNRVNLLVRALRSLEEQDLNESLYEVLVINNNSTDGTQRIANEFVAKHGNFRVIIEKRQGLSHARNCGWKEAKGEYIAYIDDDSKAPPQWLTVASVIVNHYDPDVFGGPYYPFYISDKPRWWKDSYRTREHAEKARFLRKDEKLSGGNIFFRRTILEASPGFDPTFGMSGKRIGLGEENALLMHLHETNPGLRVYYEPRLLVYHLVHPSKMTLSWGIKKRFADGRYAGKLGNPHHSLRLDKMAVWSKAWTASRRIVTGTVRALISRDLQLYPFPQNYLYERVFPFIKELGMLYERRKGATARAQWSCDSAKAGSETVMLEESNKMDRS